jgi:hypothetical protein
MKFTKITYSRLFPLQQFSNERIEVEIQVDDHESEITALELAKKTVMQFHEQSVKEEEESKVVDIQIGNNTTLAIQNARKAIEKETTLEGLNSWNVFVSGKGYESLKPYLEERKKQFTNGK